MATVYQAATMGCRSTSAPNARRWTAGIDLSGAHRSVRSAPAKVTQTTRAKEALGNLQ